MANPKAEIWGTPDTWIYSPNTTLGLTSVLSQTIHADRPKVAYFGAGTTAGYEGSLLRAINVSQKMVLNDYIDNTICPCGQDPNVSPFAKLAIFNENDDLSLTPRVVTITDNINWFFADKASSSVLNNAFNYLKQYTKQGTTNEGLKFQQFAPKANSPASSSNITMQMCPYTYYGLRSLFLSIEVHCMPKTATNPITQTNWRTLRAWKTQYAETEDIIGLRLYVRICQNINQNTLELTYSNDKAISSGQQSFVCITNPITINNDGANTPTQLLNIFNKGQRSAYIFDITEEIYNWSGGSDSRTNRAVLPCWNYFDGQTVHNWYSISSDPVRYYFYKIPYSEDTYEKIMSIAALFGCFFTDRNVNVFPYDMLSEYVYLPIIDDNGVAHGQYTNGSDNANNPLYAKNSIRDIDYNPDTPIDPNTYSDTTSWNTVNYQSAFCKRYELTAAQVGQLAAELWAAQATKPADIDYHNFAIDEYLTNNPIDTIVSLKYYPCVVETAANPAVVHLGKYQTNIAANAISHTVKVIDFDPIDVYPHFGDYRDYEPYTTLQMYIPFCGTVSIPTAEAMGKWVSVKLCIDINTGACVGYVIVSNSGSGGICVATATGTASIDIPVSGLQSANLSQAIFNATANWTQTQISNAKISSGLLSHAGGLLGNISKGLSKQGGLSPTSLLGALKGGPIGSIGLIDRLDPIKAYWSGYESEIESSKADYNLTHVEIPMRLIGSTSPALSSVIESSCRLIIYRPITDEGALSHYADTVGFATVSSGTVSQFTGYTEGTIDVSGINASASEKSEIQRLFASGVYL